MDIKKYLPFENYVLTSRLSLDEVKKRLKDNIGPGKRAKFSTTSKTQDKPYEGEIHGDTFEISRVIDGKNSFLPLIKGHISTHLGRTEIKIKARPVIFVLIFMSFWLGVVGIVCLCILTVGLSHIRDILQHGFSPMILIPFGMFAFGSLILVLGFKNESTGSKNFFKQLWDAQEAEVNRPG